VPDDTAHLHGLNPRQREAVLQTEGPVLVLAGAGSGKTRVITQRIAHLLASGRGAPASILAVTFTNKAADEMRERVAKVVGQERAARITIATFHSFCVRVLREHADQVGYRRTFTIATESDGRILLRRVLEDADRGETFSPALFQAAISLHKNSGTALGKARPKAKQKVPATQEKYRQHLPDVFERYQSALRAANSLDFDDLLLMTLQLWREHPRILAAYQQRFHYVMVDEYQDTNRVQYELLRLLVEKHRNLFVVGDDDQSIYGWRGADVRNLLEFERDFPEATIVTLDQNYRSTVTILNAANAVIRHNVKRREKQLWSNLGEGRPIDWIVTGNEEDEARRSAAWLGHIRSRTKAPYASFAVLYRSNLQSRPFEVAFRQAGIPYVVVGGQEFFERAEVKDIVSYLKVAANPHDEAAFLRVVNMPRRGVGDATLHALHDLCRRERLSFGNGIAALLKRGLAPPQAQEGLRQFLGLVQHFRARFREGGGLRAIAEELVEATGYCAEIGRTCGNREQADNRRMNIDYVLQAIGDYEARADRPTLAGFLDESSLNSDADRLSREDRKRQGVTLMTIHSAKGLEFPFVFIVGVEEGLLPHDKSLNENTLDEERRLFYVALTRARRHVTLFEALSRSRHGKVRPCKTSRFLQDIPEELIRKRVFAVRDAATASAASEPAGARRARASRKLRQEPGPAKAKRRGRLD